MTTILVVDDSAVDRQLAGGFLANDPDLTVRYAGDGAEALETIVRKAPDLVLTDLMMPKIDGLQLVAEVRRSHPLVPVILMTSKGSEEIAVQALQQGAASYVPKRMLARKLLSTVRSVLAVATRERSHSRLMGCMTQSECRFALENDFTLFGPLVAYLQEEVTRMGLCDETERMRIGVALEEGLTNALYHGNLEVGSELRGEDDKAYFALVEERRRQAPYRHRRIHVDASLSREQAMLRIRDEGSGFDPSSIPDPTDPENLEKASGRGVLLMRTFMDEVAYNEMGNTVTMTKRRGTNNHPNHDEES
ncbi:MAG TPA: response regulator [Thermoguttaceae bacterium]|nr:response regulator [Thermoguttaceae bacterium]